MSDSTERESFIDPTDDEAVEDTIEKVRMLLKIAAGEGHMIRLSAGIYPISSDGILARYAIEAVHTSALVEKAADERESTKLGAVKGEMTHAEP